MNINVSELSRGLEIAHQPAVRPLASRAAIVTGSTSGIGLGIARALAAAGANIVLNGLGDVPEIERTRARIAYDHDVRAVFVPADVSKPAEVVRMVETSAELVGEIDILVNNAGIQHVAPVEGFAPEKWDAVIAINLSSAFHAIRTVLPAMKRRGWGRIVNIASAHALVASPYKSAYVAAKHGILGLTKVVALETAESGITANAICPGYVWTPLVEKQIDEQAAAHDIPREQVIRDVLLASQPNKQFASVDEIAALTVFLCGEAAKSITGTALPVDGGWTAH